MKIAVLSSTGFGYRCIDEAISLVPEVSLAGIVSTAPRVEFKNTKPLDVATYVDFSTLADRTGAELVRWDTPPSAASYIELFDRWDVDLVLMLGWYYLVPSTVISSVSKGIVGVHGSLLPKYRGMAPINWVIINGETKTGASLFYLAKGVDTGDIIAQERLSIADEDTCATLYNKVTTSAIAMLRTYLPRLVDGSAPRHAQDHTKATRFPRRTPEDGRIDWTWSAQRIYNFVRAQTHPYPGAFCFWSDSKLTIWACRPLKGTGEKVESGRIYINADTPRVGTGDGTIELISWQFASETERGGPLPDSVTRLD